MVSPKKLSGVAPQIMANPSQSTASVVLERLTRAGILRTSRIDLRPKVGQRRAPNPERRGLEGPAVRLLLVAGCLALLAACEKPESRAAPSALAPSAVHGHSDEAHEAAPSATAPPASAPSNPVQKEMQLLTAALEGAVRGIGMGDVRAVEHDLHRVHAAKEATEEALKSGGYKPPKNPDKLERFEALDGAFHTTLERLVEASKQNDVPATAAALGTALQACQGCHSEFRQ